MNRPNFNKQIDTETKKKIRQFAKISKINSLQRMKDKSIPRVDMRFLLFNYYKKCFWCDIEVVEYGIPDSKFDNQSTLDHVVSKFYRDKGDDVLKVLCCHSCNKARATYENRKLTKKHKAKLSPPILK